MPDEGKERTESNFQLFRDCVFDTLTNQTGRDLTSKKKPRKRRSISQVEESSFENEGANTLVDFSDYFAEEIFQSLPQELRTLSHQAIEVLEEITDMMPGSVEDSLTAYGIINPPKSDVQSFLSPIMAAYVAAATTPPPKWISTKASACEICERDWVPLTYHHLIPREVHAKVLKRGWHDENQLNSVAWLCRACHSFVHKMASNEELATDWYTVDKICSREDVEKWAQWVGRIRWRKR